jgi:Flp pilus assembly protein TadD
MRQGAGLVTVLVGLMLLTGCGGSSRLADSIPPKPVADALATGSTAPTADFAESTAAPEPLDGSANADLNAGKTLYRSGDYAAAQRRFHRAVEADPRDAEAWLGLAASYDQLRRFDLADRAYEKVAAIVGPTPELLNNRGYSYMLRGDKRRARVILLKARAMDPSNAYVQNNLDLLDKKAGKGKVVR